MKEQKLWINYVIISVIFMGVWGALIEIPEKNGFPATLGYVVWSITMIPAAIIITGIILAVISTFLMGIEETKLEESADEN